MTWRNRRRAAAAFAAAAALLFLTGLFRTASLEREYHTCTQWRYGVPDGRFPDLIDMDRRLFPPQATCRWKDGHTLNRVPWPIGAGLPLLLAASAITAASARHSKRKTPAA
ncbi:hypothetical protein [Actinomadura macrotermitis]|uniref:hypothetical protein n=1 Tax=Actinomadura macrotermitis TaxID=2585200 RepID=UPI001296DED9|nr:hypothetical protein [Actinomadura macrotermitis]